MKESGSTRTKRMVGSVGAGSTWESRMKNDEAKVGNGIFNGGQVTKGRYDNGVKPKTSSCILESEESAVNAITDTNIISKSEAAEVEQDTKSKSECVSDSDDTISIADAVEGRGQRPNSDCTSTSSSSKSKDASASPSSCRVMGGLKKTRSEPPLDKMITNSSPLIRKMKSEPNRAVVVASLANKRVCSYSNSKKDKEEVVNCTRKNESSSQPQGNGSSSPTMMKSDSSSASPIEFNPLGIINAIPNQIKSGVEEASSPNPDHDPGKKSAEDKVKIGDGDKKELVGDGSEIEVGNGIGANTALDNAINNKNNEIKITSVHGSKPQLNKRPSSISTPNGVRKSFPTLRKPSPSLPGLFNNSTNWKESTQPSSEEACRTPECHGRFQSLVDLVMWRDISRSSFVFGIGSFFIIWSSYAKDVNISLISGASYVGLVYLAITFLYRSIMRRGMIDEGARHRNVVVGEEEAVWMLKLILPYINEVLSKMRDLFSGDPALTIKMAFILFVLARCGTSITIWKVIQLGFFGVFIIPKLCSSYSTHMIAYAKFWVQRINDAWRCCSHKKFVAFAIFTLLWNCCSTVARLWAAFMLYAALQYYQHSFSDACSSVQVEEDDDHTRVPIHKPVVHHRRNLNKGKKSF